MVTYTTYIVAALIMPCLHKNFLMYKLHTIEINLNTIFETPLMCHNSDARVELYNLVTSVER